MIEAGGDRSAGVRRAVTILALVLFVAALTQLLVVVDVVASGRLSVTAGYLVTALLGDVALAVGAFLVVRSWRASTSRLAWQRLGWAGLAYSVGFVLLASAHMA